jgi:hypothetical protein
LFDEQLGDFRLSECEKVSERNGAPRKIAANQGGDSVKVPIPGGFRYRDRWFRICSRSVDPRRNLGAVVVARLVVYVGITRKKGEKSIEFSGVCCLEKFMDDERVFSVYKIDGNLLGVSFAGYVFIWHV